jgi:hypothetical protein
VEILKSDPSRKFLVRELIQITHAKPDAVRQAVSRLSKIGKGSGPVRKIDHGMYQYAPEKELDSLEALVQLGNWKTENLVFVTKGAEGGSRHYQLQHQTQKKIPIVTSRIPVFHYHINAARVHGHFQPGRKSHGKITRTVLKLSVYRLKAHLR